MCAVQHASALQHNTLRRRTPCCSNPCDSIIATSVVGLQSMACADTDQFLALIAHFEDTLREAVHSLQAKQRKSLNLSEPPCQLARRRRCKPRPPTRCVDASLNNWPCRTSIAASKLVRKDTTRIRCPNPQQIGACAHQSLIMAKRRRSMAALPSLQGETELRRPDETFMSADIKQQTVLRVAQDVQVSPCTV
jgi:hypothetical protein